MEQRTLTTIDYWSKVLICFRVLANEFVTVDADPEFVDTAIQALISDLQQTPGQGIENTLRLKGGDKAVELTISLKLLDAAEVEDGE